MNKILKDMIIRYKNMTGHYAPYVPGWDTHGMPIETAIQKIGRQAQRACPCQSSGTSAGTLPWISSTVSGNSSSRLGVIGDWEHPYITLKPEFEAKQIKVFGAMAEKGYIYQGLKPVYWCPTCETALAEAEVEYADDPVTTIYVKFKVHDDKGKLAQYGDLEQDVLRHLDDHHLDSARQHGHLPQSPVGVLLWSRPIGEILHHGHRSGGQRHEGFRHH